MVNGTSTGTSTLRFVHVDHLGSTNVVSSATGTIAQWFDYAPYGSVLGSSGSGMKRQYIGQYADDSGLSYLNARYKEWVPLPSQHHGIEMSFDVMLS